MKIITIIIILLAASDSFAQQLVRDSLLNSGRSWRANRIFDAALDDFTRAGGEQAEYEIAETHYSMGKVALAVSECKQIIKKESPLASEARVLLALCREAQGFERAAIYNYRKEVGANNPLAAYHYASMMYRKGRYERATNLAQQCITWDKSIPEAHYLLASIMANQGERVKAMLPLYYFLLINDEEESQRIAYAQLLNLWRKSAKALRLVQTNRTPDPFNDQTDKYIDGIATDSISHLSAEATIDALAAKTDSLFNYLLQTSEKNLDFYQVMYSDFFVTLVPRNFVAPYVRYISATTYEAQALEWIAREEYLFNEFTLWMEAQ